MSAPEALAQLCDPHQSHRSLVFGDADADVSYIMMLIRTQSHQQTTLKAQQMCVFILNSRKVLQHLHISTAGCSSQCGRRSGRCAPRCCTGPPGAVSLQASGLLPWPVGEEHMLTAFYATTSNILVFISRWIKTKCEDGFTSRMVVSFSFSFPALFFTCVFLVSTHTTLSFTSDLNTHTNTC